MNYLVHYYRNGTQPFHSLTDLDDDAATKLMNELYIKDSLLWERFSSPKQYLDARRGTEKWLYDEFTKKGGKPPLERPIYFVLGESIWFNENENKENKKMTSQIQIPLEIFDETEISFTYPDSMLTLLLSYQKDPNYYLPEYHGKVFTLREINSIKENLKGVLPEKMPNYIEVQVWNKEKILYHLSSQHS